MIAVNLQSVAEAVLKRAQRQGSVAPGEVREELSQAGVEETHWKEVVALTRPSLSYHKGRYYYAPPLSDAARREQILHRKIQRAVRQLVRGHRAAAASFERRENDRVDFIHPVKVVTEDDKTYHLLSRDVSSTGIRLVGTKRLLGQKVRVFIPQAGQGTAVGFVVRVLWTCAVGDDLFENGGTFLDLDPTTGAG